MDRKENKRFECVRKGIISGCGTILGASALLLPAAFLIWRGVISEQRQTVLILAAVFIAGLVSGSLAGKAGEGETLLFLLSAAGGMTLLLMLMTLAMKNAELAVSRLVPITAAGTAGVLGGSKVKINKKYLRKNRARRKYNKKESK